MSDEQQALDELVFIRKVIVDSRKSLGDNGMGYIVWGVIVVLGLIYTYLNISLKWYFHINIFWTLLMAAGWLWSITYFKGRIRSLKVSTFAGRIIGSIWLSAGVGMTMVAFLATFIGGVSGDYVSPFIAIILMMAYYISGVVSGSKILKLAALGWFFGAIILFIFSHQIINILLMAILMICFQLIPGLILNIQYKKEMAKYNA
ncbi:MAG: hypothetical protein LWX56_06375 [Ignavibacteria bacterium]|nr:hypothetical protein [Ignavibacteria bacterium]